MHWFDERNRCVCDSVTSKCPSTLTHTRRVTKAHEVILQKSTSLSIVLHLKNLSTENFLFAHHDGEDQGHDVDGVGGTKAGEDSQAQIAAQWRRRLLFSSGDAVQEGAGTQGTLHLRVQGSQCHAASINQN